MGSTKGVCPLSLKRQGAVQAKEVWKNAKLSMPKSMETWMSNKELIIDSSGGALLYWNHTGELKIGGRKYAD